MKPVVLLICCAATLLLPGCLALFGPRPVAKAQLTAPEAYRSASTGNQGKISTGWVATFRDRNLDGLVDEALKYNLDIQEASANLKAANETRNIARAARLPGVGFTGAAARIRRGDGFLPESPPVAEPATPTTTTTTTTAPDGTVTTSTSTAAVVPATAMAGASGSRRLSTTSLATTDYGLSVEASWELDLWGRLRDLDQAAAQDYIAALADFRGARLSLAASTSRSWFDLVTTRLQVALAEMTLASYESNMRIIERNFKAGDDTASALDVQFGRNNVASAQRALVARRLARDEASRSLEVLLGRYPKANVRSTSRVWQLYFGIIEGKDGQLRFAGELPALPAQIPAGLPSDLLWRRPDLVAAAADLSASAGRARAARKDLLPSINLTGRASTSSVELGRMLTDPNFIVWNAAASVAQTIYQGGAPSAEVRRALADNEAALRRFASLALGAFREVESALATDLSLAQQEKFLEVELRQAALAEKQSAREYSDGIVGILSILEAQRRAVNARNSMILLRNQRLQNRVDLHLALGGDFTTPPPDPPQAGEPGSDS